MLHYLKNEFYLAAEGGTLTNTTWGLVYNQGYNAASSLWGSTVTAGQTINAEKASQMSAGDQQAMIRSMVDGLDQKLAANPDNLEGWLRLIRARVVLGDTDR